MIQGDVLKAIITPLTKAEIAERTGYNLEQVREAISSLRERGVEFEQIGYGSHMHYYLPAYKQKELHSVKFVYRQLLDLIDTGEWWARFEICEILDIDARTITNSIRFINRKGYAKIISKRIEGNRAAYKVVSSNEYIHIESV